MTTSTVTERVERVRFEHHREPIGIGERRPRLSWAMATAGPGWAQEAYQLEVRSIGDGRIYTTDRVISGESVLVPWPEHLPDLVSRQRVEARVRVWGNGTGASSEWSERAGAEAGLLDPGDWHAPAISPGLGLGEPPGPAWLLRGGFVVDRPVARARLYVTAWGLYEIEVNGARVGDELLAPGWTSYSHRLQYQTYDVTGSLRRGANALGAMVADGWFRGRLGFAGGVSELYGDRLALLTQLEVIYVDGTAEVVGTGPSWRCSSGPIVSTGLYEGEVHDARLEQPGWSSAGFDDSAWAAVEVVKYDASVLVAPKGPPVRRIETLIPVSLSHAVSGRLIVDFGQNISGRLRVRVQAPAGHRLRLRHAEVLEDGELSLRPLRHAAAMDEYVSAGKGLEEWEPRFTMHGFRYAELEGWLGNVSEGSVQAVVCHTDMLRTGEFACSDEMLDRLHDNIVWSMRDNFVSIPTDCPQRDERLGWTGDIACFAPTASFLYDCSGVLASWMADLKAEQLDLGTVPHYVPWVPLTFPLVPVAAWGDAAVIVPWTLYQQFGDRGILSDHLVSMKAWVDQVAALAGEGHLWDHGFQLGDWLDPAAPPDRPEASQTDRYLVATAYHARSAALLGEAAGVLGMKEDQAHYAALAGAVRQAFQQEFVTPSGRLSSDTQTAYALALVFDLLATDPQRQRAGKRLVELVAAEGYRIGTGFVGTPLVLDALSSVGAHDIAYHLLLQRECPSWLFAVTMGATTVWERWDSMLSDGTVNPGEMTSFNHYAFGSVADWVHRTLVGLAPGAPGYRRILVKPQPGGGLVRAEAEHSTPYGRAAVAWRRTGATLKVVVTVPPNTTASVQLPGSPLPAGEFGSGTHTLECEFRDPADDPAMPKPDLVDIHSELGS